MPRYAYVHVGSDAAGNFDIGMDSLIWGWKQRRYGALVSEATDWLARPSQPTYLAFVQKVEPSTVVPGWPRTAEDDLGPWLTASYGAITIARLVGSLYRSTDPVWPDDIYEYRVRFDSLTAIGNVTGGELHPEAVQAIRDSVLRRGLPILGPEPLIVGTLDRPEDIMTLLRNGASETSSRVLSGADSPTVEFAFGVDVPDRLLEGLDSLDGFARAIVRVEQQTLRRYRFGSSTSVACAVCGRVLPVGLVRLAHIKRRSEANRDERLMLENTMPACTLGCDELFERGYLAVDTFGVLTANETKPTSGDLAEIVKALANRPIHGYTANQEQFFAWHRTRHGCA